MTNAKKPAYRGLVCPADETHGPLLELRDGSLLCPHIDHDGRSASHAEGKKEPSPKFFKLHQLRDWAT